MKKKLMLSMFATLILSLIIVTSLFIMIVNYEYMDVIKRNLQTNNKIIINLLDKSDISNSDELLNDAFKSNSMRITLIDKDGKVIYDSNVDKETLNNHNKREEVIKARKYGEGSSIRYSISTHSSMIYYATSFKNGYVIRSSIFMKNITGFEGKYIKYYIIVFIIAAVVSLIFASNLSNIITRPIKDLELATARMAEGKLDRRVSIKSHDEIGKLGKTFNNMADKLEITLNDSIDKQNKLEAILKSMDSGVIAVDNSYKVIMINPYAKLIFGINKDIIGQSLIDNIRDFDFENIFKEKIEDSSEIKILWPKERILRVRTADIINNGAHIGTVAVVQDITDIKRLENMRSQFVANVTHELKTPLTSIKGFAETLRYVDDGANKEKFLDIINDEADRLTRLIDDILTLSDIESYRELKRETVDVNEVITNVVQLVSNSAAKKNMNICLDLHEVPNIIGDKDKFKQMLINLADNAIKYSEDGAEVIIGSKKTDSNCIIWVMDTGMGIPPQHLDRIFERFYRVDKARSRSLGGTGLGLAIVKHIVMSFGGTINVESTIGEGSKFTVNIPINTENKLNNNV